MPLCALSGATYYWWSFRGVIRRHSALRDIPLNIPFGSGCDFRFIQVDVVNGVYLVHDFVFVLADDGYPFSRRLIEVKTADRLSHVVVYRHAEVGASVFIGYAVGRAYVA